jgi:hypothetical protein
MPYLDPTLLEFLIALPARKFGTPGFHDDVIRSSFPEHAAIPYASGSKATARLSLQDQFSYFSCCWKAGNAGLLSLGFVSARLLRLVGTQASGMDSWWLQQMVYLLGIRGLVPPIVDA